MTDTLPVNSVEISVVDRESGINSTRYKIVDRRNNDNIVFQGVEPAATRYAPETKRRKRVNQTINTESLGFVRPPNDSGGLLFCLCPFLTPRLVYLPDDQAAPLQKGGLVWS